MNLTDRLSGIPQAIWNRRGAIAQVAIGIAKNYAAFEISRRFPTLLSLPQGNVDPTKALLGTLTYTYLMASGIGDFVQGVVRSRHAGPFNPREFVWPEYARKHHASGFGTFETYAYYLFRTISRAAASNRH